jgi:hypothetical protein
MADAPSRGTAWPVRGIECSRRISAYQDYSLIYFCIPALNEERTVGVVLWKLRQVMTELQRDFQIIVVDDASTDATQQVLNPYARVLPLTLIRNEKQLGYAASMEIAIREAVRRSPYPKRDALITLQADFTEDPDVVPALIKRIEAGADLVAVTPQLDEATPGRVRNARRLFKWLLRAHEWAQLADPFSGLRAYRVMAIKRALEARGSTRLLSWEGWAANAELLAQTVPHSRRTDTLEVPLHYRRLQRDSRFRLLNVLTQMLGVRTGKPSRAAPVALPDTTIVVPAALAVELATSHSRDEARRRQHAPRREEPKHRRERSGRDGEPRARRENGQRKKPTHATRPAPTLVEAAAEPMVAPAPEREKRRRRSRKRSRKRAQPQQQEIVGPILETETNPAAVEEAAAQPAEGAARKKSRRGRRGGRGRRRGTRPNAPEQQNNNNGQDNAGEATPQ